ncbi:MAG: hypothetical protein JNL74_16115, partial [Fibrobacteres bacterium]|nr:hypothetical protein [Fibrobacterota bacterium]
MKLFLLCLTILYTVLYPATYYVASSGDDSYTTLQAQNSATPWKSLAKINGFTFTPGD